MPELYWKACQSVQVRHAIVRGRVYGRPVYPPKSIWSTSTSWKVRSHTNKVSSFSLLRGHSSLRTRSLTTTLFFFIGGNNNFLLYRWQCLTTLIGICLMFCPFSTIACGLLRHHDRIRKSVDFFCQVTLLVDEENDDHNPQQESENLKWTSPISIWNLGPETNQWLQQIIFWVEVTYWRNLMHKIEKKYTKSVWVNRSRYNGVRRNLCT